MRENKSYAACVMAALLVVFAAGCSSKDRDRNPSIPDTTPPTVEFVSPANRAVDAAINGKITATFSEDMDLLTITTATFTIDEGSTPILGTIVCAGLNATFTPSSNLATATVHTATITTEVTDLAGNALEVTKVWTFTTGAAPDISAPTVSFTIPANATTGVAVNSAVTATFSEAMDPLTTTSSTFTLTRGSTPVSGAVTYAVITATFTPDSDFEFDAEYTATITTGAKDLAGNALAAAKTWTFTTGTAPDITAPTVSFTIPANAATGVALNSAMTATFSEAMRPLTITKATFTLTRGSTPVSGAVTYAVITATFTPDANLSPLTVYTATITTGVKDLAGNALAAVKTWSFTTGAAPDITAPTVSFTIPANSATEVAVNSSVTATFSEAMDPLTISTATFTMMQGSTPVPGAVTYAVITATFTPDANLSPLTAYSATITTGAKDLAGNALAVNKVWTFTTGAAQDITAPTVSFTIPANSATEVAVNSSVTATFSEAMDPLTINTATFAITEGLPLQPLSLFQGVVTYAGITATFTPTSNFAASTTYIATITTGVMDLAGNALAVNKVWTFTTGAAPDISAPTVILTIPANDATGVPINRIISATFSETMDLLTITTATFTVKQGATPVIGTVTYAGTIATFTPAGNLASSTVYTATIKTGAKDLAGNPLENNYAWNFTTGVDTIALSPVVLGQTSHFAVLAGYAVTTVPASAITGDLGLSPAAESFITGFSQTDWTGYATSPQVTGKIYAADMATPTPAMLTTAKGDLTIAYNDAAARTPVPTGSFLNPGAGDLAGLNLAPGLYKFTGGAQASTNFTLTGSANDVWIFQIETTLIISNGVQVTLAGGAKADNIFWKVGTQATLGTTVIFHGTIMAEASITMNTGAILYGRALAFSATIALDQSTIIVPIP